MHDALGFRSTKTGLNYTMEWYELDQLFNCTFPHELDDQSLKWCNQGTNYWISSDNFCQKYNKKTTYIILKGALCVYEGINDTVWTQYGSLQKISILTGDIFNQFANWSIWDNNTAVYYETWSVYNTHDPTKNDPLVMYFDSFDCASWVLR